jgi:hypothetical protein
VIHGRAGRMGEDVAWRKHAQHSADRAARVARAEDGMIQRPAALRTTFVAGQGLLR